MRIVQVIAGAGTRFYCENCARDESLARGLGRLGHEVLSGVLYLPGAEPARSPLFYGAVSMYLGHRFPRMRSVPPWMIRLLDAPALLRLAGALSGSTDPRGLEELTLSMLRGEEGGEAAELDRLIRWLSSVKPDVVHLSNCLLLGVARRIRGELSIPVVCSLQDEDTWIDAMSEEHRRTAWRILGERAKDVELFLPVSEHYRRFMTARLGLSAERMRVVPIGIDLDGFGGAAPAGEPTIGFLSHICAQMGAGILAEAFLTLAREARFSGLSLRFAGGSTGTDTRFIRALRRSFDQHSLSGRVRFARSFSREGRISFLSSLGILSVPVQGGEAFGTFILESLAAGVPVVQPALGGFVELVDSTGGGILYHPNTPEALAEALARLLSDPAEARRLAARGREAVRREYTADRMAARMEQAFLAARGGGY